jgi:hypothetical protein
VERGKVRGCEMKLFVFRCSQQFKKFRRSKGRRYQKKCRVLKVCYVPATSAACLASFFFFFATATNSTNGTIKAGGTCH